MPIHVAKLREDFQDSLNASFNLTNTISNWREWDPARLTKLNMHLGAFPPYEQSDEAKVNMINEAIGSLAKVGLKAERVQTSIGSMLVVDRKQPDFEHKFTAWAKTSSASVAPCEQFYNIPVDSNNHPLAPELAAEHISSEIQKMLDYARELGIKNQVEAKLSKQKSRGRE